MPDHSKPDWREEASRRLADSKLSAFERQEIARELGGYLDDLCCDASARGFDEDAARKSAAAELCEDEHLGANLYRARKEGVMHLNERTKRLWIPGLAALFVAESVLYSVHLDKFALHFSLGAAHTWYIALNLPWLCALPLLGAAAACWSRRQGAGRPMQAAAGLFPLLLFAGSFLGGPGVAALPIRVGLGEHPWAVHQVMAMYLPWILIGWVCIPLTLLLAGVLPGLGRSNASAGSGARQARLRIAKS